MRTKKLFINTLLLTAAALLMRYIALTFQVYLSNKIGASGIGLFQLIMSAQILAVTFSVSGIRYAVTRLVSEQLGTGAVTCIRPTVRRCLGYGIVCSIIASSFLLLMADRIGRAWIGDARTILSIRILAFAMPFLSISSVMSGYFIAVQRIIKSSSAQILEQVVGISAVLLLLTRIPLNNLEYACAAISVGNVLGEILGFALVFILYLFDVRRYRGKKCDPTGLTRRMFAIAVPLALSSYARTALGTLYHMLVPKGLQKSGASAESALASYGTISGMVLPILLFPLAFFSSLSEMLIPDLTDAQVRGDSALAARIINRTLSVCMFFSIGVCGIFFAFSDQFGNAIYKSSEAGNFIRVFSPLVIVMYMDTVTDGMLKGLGQHIQSMFYNILDAFLSVIMVFFLLPKYAVAAYVLTIFVTETINFALSIRRLGKVATVSLPLRDILLPFVCIVGAVNIAVLVLRMLGLALTAAALPISVYTVLTLAIYYALLRIFSCVTASDLRSFKTLFKAQ